MTTLGSALLPSQAARFERRIGISSEALPVVVENWIHHSDERLLLIVAPSAKQADQLVSDFQYFHEKARSRKVKTQFALLPEQWEKEEDTGDAFDIESDRIAVFSQLAAGQNQNKLVLVATPKSLAQKTPSPESLKASKIELAPGQNIPFSDLSEQLQQIDYDAESLCEAPGQFAVRGGLIDVYPITAEKPYRVDFFGDEIESIKELDPVSQRSGKPIQSISIAASPRLDLETNAAGILDYLPDSMAWALIEPDDILDAIHHSSLDTNDSSEGEFWIRILQNREQCLDSWTTFSDLDLANDDVDDSNTITYEAESLSFYRPLSDSTKLADERLASEQQSRLRFLELLGEWGSEGEQIVFILPNTSDKNRVKDLLKGTTKTKSLKPIFWQGDLNQGFRIHFRDKLGKLDWPFLKDRKGAVFVTETELFGRRRHRKPRTRQRALVSQAQVDQLLDFAEMVEGEFVVHVQHGIALYRGITKVDIRGQLREALTLEFDEGMLLHVPLQESHLISRYVGLTKTRPRLGKLGSNRWAKTREAAERATLDLAAQLLEIQATREAGNGHAFGQDVEWQTEFEKSFPFKETPDQMQAILDTKSDMQLSKPMDRLICGDVGYGKTEIAIRAAFKAVMDGKQVAILVPTTVLAQQHFITFRDRMAGYPIVVEHVSRFRKPSEIKKILQALKGGKVDILIGTHRLIQKDVSFSELGLVVIDEEQRFGVKHKEVFKEWRETVDILSMSATPIPRTLYMALTGARELSVIETPPLERKPIQTIVKSYSDDLVKEVIQREIDRGGQVFYLHNRVQTIDTVALKLQELMPKVSFGIGHGQMNEKELEQVMIDFVDGRYQVLVCTTIIESGLDIPNSNTIIIEGADRFGLSQLYQIRGRVGRFKRQAYAYLLLHKHKRLMDIARKRLQAIRQHNQLGAGFRIAMRDLELRGAGNLLGPEQSGHIVGVGFELYCQLLKQSIARLKGEKTAIAIRANVKLDFIYQGEGQLEDSNKYEDGYTILKKLDLEEGECEPMQARIPASYLDETRLRIDMYRKLAMAEKPEDIENLREDMIDRFGKFPLEVEALLKLTEIRCRAEAKGILSVESEGNRLKCRIKRGKEDDYIKLGTRFPRLVSNDALKRLDEIIVFLRNFATS